MSVVSRKSKASHLSSILRTPSIQSRLNSTRAEAKVRFRLPYAKRVRTILEDYQNGSNVREYEQLIVAIRDSEILDEDIFPLLEEAQQCISVLSLNLRLFVEVLLSIKWVTRSPKIVAEYQSFILNLISAHNYHAKYAIDKLVTNFLPDNDEADWENGIPTDEQSVQYASTHWVFNVLLELVPMSAGLLINSLSSHFPYLKKSSHVHEVYFHNLLLILDYQPQLRLQIFRLIFSKLILLDVNAPREEITNAECSEENDIFEMDESLAKSNQNDVKHLVGRSLDICLDKLLHYFIVHCHDIKTGDLVWENTKGLYHDMLSIFDDIILPTYNTHHVQFAMFTLCTFKSAITEAFLNYLWKKVCTPTVGSVIRQSAVAYMASLIARGLFVPLTMLKGTLQQMAEWIHSYIASQDGNEYVITDIRIHGVFYCVCQALFYVVAFRQKDLVNTKKNISFLESLNLGKIVTSRLNPLRACQAAVVQNFAAVTRTYQLAYCYSIIEHNSRSVIPTVYQDEKGSLVTISSTLDALFPFDPLTLKRSVKKISPFYLEYQKPNDGSGPSQCTKENKDMEVDDFLCDNNDFSTPTSKNLERFSYGTSPGFKHRI